MRVKFLARLRRWVEVLYTDVVEFKEEVSGEEVGKQNLIYVQEALALLKEDVEMMWSHLAQEKDLERRDASQGTAFDHPDHLIICSACSYTSTAHNPAYNCPGCGKGFDSAQIGRQKIR